MKKEIISLMLICFFIGFCVSALIFTPVFYDKGFKAGCPCSNNHNFSFTQDTEVFYEGEYNINGLGENRTD